MDNHKKIGNALKNRLNDLNYESSDNVWNNIIEELDKKKKPVVFWWRIGIISSVVLILFSIYYINKNHTITKGEENKDDEIENIDNIIVFSNRKDSLNLIKSQHNIVSKKNNTLKSINQNSKNNTSDIKYKNKTTNEIDKNNNNNLSNTTVVVLNKEKLISNESFNDVKGNEMKDSIKHIKTNKNESNLSNINVAFLNKEKLISNKSLKNNKAENRIKDSIKNKKIKDSIKHNIKDKKNITKNKKPNSNLKRKTKTPWQINVKIAPIFSSSFSKGSSLGKDVINNSKNKKITLSYGVNAEMELNKKTKLRAGINKLNFSNITNEVSSENVLGNPSISINNFDFLINSSNPNLPLADRRFNITQKTTYIELPFEIIYSLIQKKISINTVTGFSFLILDTNILLVEDTIEFGSVNNLKNLSFTGNLGLGFNYKLTNKLHFNLEPVLKIQFNTYKNNIVYKPYFFGVYSGFSYKF